MTVQEFIQRHGYNFEPTQLDGEFHEFQDSLGNKGWYIGSELSTGKITLTFGDWRKPGENFSFLSSTELTDLERKEFKDAQSKFQRAKESRQEQTKRICQDLFTRWDRIGSSGLSRYLSEKQLPHRFPGTIVKPVEPSGHVLVIPMRDEHGTLWNFQSIFDDGQKQFFNFGRVDGLYFEIPGEDKTYIVEGFATGLALHISTHARVIVAFNLSNLKSVAAKFDGAEIVADHDGATLKRMRDAGHEKPLNPGLVGAAQVALELERKLWSLAAIDSEESVDVSDVFIEGGPELVRGRLAEIPREKIEEILSGRPVGHTSPEPDEIKPLPQYDPQGIYVGDIPTYSTGFHWSELKKGTVVYHPDYEDLRKYFERKTDYKILGDSRICHTWNGSFYEPLGDVFIEAFAQEHFNPPANNHKVSEFLRLVLRTNVKPQEFFNVERKINFKNGYLDLESGNFHPHSKDIGFRYCLPYNYEAEAQAPRFEKFLGRVTLGDQGLQQLLLEFMGYALSGDSCWAQKALVLTGEGSNGKSTFMNIMRHVGGDNSHTPMSLSELRSEYKLQLLDGKLFNMAEETPSRALVDSSVFKNLVGGGTVIVRQIYKAPYQTRMKAKLIFACNDLPKSEDTTHAFYRRFFIVPFKATFSPNQPDFDPFIEEKLKKELSGIFNMVLKAYMNLKARGRFEETDTVVQAVQDFKVTSDPLRYWLSEEVKVHPLGNGHDLVWVSMAELYSEYKIFCDDAGFDALNKIAFGKKLAGIIDEYDKRVKMGGPEKQRAKGLIGITRSHGSAFKTNKLFTYGGTGEKDSQGKVDGMRLSLGHGVDGDALSY